MLRGTHNPKVGTNAMAFWGLLACYAQEVSPFKRGHQDELIRIRADTFVQAENWIPSGSIQAGLQKIHKPTHTPQSHAHKQYVARFITAHGNRVRGLNTASTAFKSYQTEDMPNVDH